MRLSMKERRVLTKALCAQYRKAGKKEKGALLDRFVEATGYNRVYGARLLRNHGREVWVAPGAKLRGDARRKTGPRPRKVIYGPDVVVALKKIWALLDYIAAKRLAAALPEIVPRLIELKELRVRKEVREKLMTVSAATIDRLLKSERAKHQLKSRSRTKPGTLLKHHIPIRTFSDWEDARPGFFEMDLVGHDGGSAKGDYCFTLDITDVSSGWSEQAATLNKAQTHVFAALERIRQRLPFPILGLDSDNGSEFINNQLRRFCEQEHITFTRSRPYRKNDTCYVEQKNWSVVRRFAGYDRFDSERACALLNDLYALLRDYTNFFLPSMKLVEKIRDGAKVTRRYDIPKTPYRRLLESNQLDAAAKRRLTLRYNKLNPAALQRRIRSLQKTLTALSAKSRAKGAA